MGQDKYATQPNIDWDAIDARIDARLELERKCIREVVVDAFGEVAAKKEKVAKDQIEALRTQFEKLDSLFTEWRRCFKAEGTHPPPRTPTQIN
jgi:hypothetical protein